MTASVLKAIHPESMAPEPGAWSHVVTVDLSRASRLVLIAGQTALHPDGSHAEADDLQGQLDVVYANLRRCLAGADATFADVAALRTFLTPRVDVAAFRTARDRMHRDLFPDRGMPPNTLVVCHGLAIPELMVEIEAVAAVPGRPAGA